MDKKHFLLLMILGLQYVLNAQIINNDTEDSTPIDKPRVRLVVLNTTDVTLTQNHIDRLRDIGVYVEDYYISELTAKGYSLTNTNMFARNSDGDILIYLANSTESSSAISNLTTTGINLAKTSYTDLTDLNTVWAIAHFKTGGGFVGGGTVNKGRMRLELKDASGAIDFSSNMAQTNYHRNISLKAIHHELGHALTVLHNGPLRTNTLFNILMGPINQAYENTVGVTQTAAVHLSDYTAAIIAYHPIFRDTAFDISELNTKTLKIEKILGDDDLLTVDCTTGIAHVRGKVVSNLPFHHVVIRFTYDNLESSGYWNTSFAVIPDTNGVFDLQFVENDINIGLPTQNEFQYEVMIAFDNGLTRGVTQLGVDEPIAVSKNQYVGDYSFDNDPSISQNITQSGSTLSTDYGSATYYQWIDCNNNNESITGANSQSYTPNSIGNYAVKIAAPNGCIHTSNCYNVTALGINDSQHTSDLFDVYRDPSNMSFIIKSNSDNIIGIELFNLTGQKMFQNNFKEGRNRVALNPLTMGIYILHIKTSKGVYNMKIIASE